MNFGLRDHRGMRPEALDNAPDERPDKDEVTSTGASPSRAAASNRSRTKVMNSVSLEGCIVRVRASPWPTIDSAKACSHCADSAISGR